MKSRTSKSLLDKFISWKLFPYAAILMILFGSWLNAQGGWIKDFAQYRTVNLPLLFITFSTSGPNWYLVGMVEDISGLLLALGGVYLIRYILAGRLVGVLEKPYFIITVMVYILFDFISSYYYYLYNAGSVTLVNYGYVWNDSEYFAMLPMFLLSCLLMMAYRKK